MVDEQKKAVTQAGVAVDIGVRLAMLAAAKTATPEEIEDFMQAIKDSLITEYGPDRDVASESFDKTLAAVLEMSKVCHSE